MAAARLVALFLLGCSAAASARDFDSSSVFDFAKDAASAAVKAESHCTDLIDRSGRCSARAEVQREAKIAMVKAGQAIDIFYVKCDLVMQRDLASCDQIMRSFLHQARGDMWPIEGRDSSR